MVKRRTSINRKFGAVLLGSVAFGISCANDPYYAGSTTNPNQDLTAQNSIGATITFNQTDYFSLLSPNFSNCAGDYKTYYKPFDYRLPNTETLASLGSNATSYPGPTPYTAATGPTGPVPFNEDYSTGMTQKPSFIKNISVDLTDTSANHAANAAQSCSMLPGPNVAAASNCATFDYGSIGGVPATLGGSMVLVGGVQGMNYAGIIPSTVAGITPHGMTVSCGPVQSGTHTSCGQSMFALGIDSLPKDAATNPPSTLAPGLTEASGPISSWVNLTGGATGPTGPAASAGAAMTYDPGLQQILHYGGVAPLDTIGPTGPAGDQNSTWIYDLKTLSWTASNSSGNASAEMKTMRDFNTLPDPDVEYSLSRDPGARADFGYVAVPNVALSGTTSDGYVVPGANGNIDTTERIIIVGGRVSTSGSDYRLFYTYKFNPTFGPEIVDKTGADHDPTHWVDSYHTQLMGNQQKAASRFSYDTTNPDPPVSLQAYNPGIARVTKKDGTNQIAGSAIAIGGFHTVTDAASNNITVLIRSSGDMQKYSQYFIAKSNGLDDKSLAPINWSPLGNVDKATGGASVLQGLIKNDVVYFGGAGDPTDSSTKCRTYLTSGMNAACYNEKTGKILTFLADLSGFNPRDLAGGTFPTHAGMAAVRGEGSDEGKPIIVAWGGMTDTSKADDNTIYILYKDVADNHYWTTLTPTGTKPTPLANAQMVYSHVTRKFYVFGGYSPSATPKTRGDTWELTVTGNTAADFSVTWKQLNPSGTSGLTCNPSACPVARHSHRMTEVNYNVANVDDPLAEPTAGTKCDANSPCSFGIFMEGGSNADGTLLGDRWMFDPTANAGMGHWQRVDGFPPRRLASTAAVDYYVPGSQKTVHRAVMFGGETGMLSPVMAAGMEAGDDNYFVAPTLGDTHIYDFDNKTWNRVKLLGRGYKAGITATGKTALEKRQSYYSNIADNPLATLTPPPLSGAVMVTRKVAQGTNTVPKIPEVYLFGGRTKDGKYHSLENVYKFCIGTTGEKTQLNSTDTITEGTILDPDSTECDSYDPNNNPRSPSPTSDYVGRWLKKTPTSTDFSAPKSNFFMGAAAYDSTNDTIVLYGGLKTGDAVTSTFGGASDTTTSDDTNIYRYTPPGKVATSPEFRHGFWTTISACDYDGAELPVGRYGHSMAYDPLTQQLVIVGGTSATGTPLTQAITGLDGEIYYIPEVWTAKLLSTENDIPTEVTGGATVTTPCYLWQKKTIFGNTTDNLPGTLSASAAGLSHATAFFVDSGGYNTGYYTLFDQACIGSGPISSSAEDPNTTKQFAGGMYIDLDRSALGENENVLLNVTYLPLGPLNTRPDGQPYSTSENAIIKIHLMRIGDSADTLQSMLQPRHREYYNDVLYPEVVKTLGIFAPPSGGIRQDQFLIPLSTDSSIDRIRIERTTGSAILIDASVFRMGKP